MNKILKSAYNLYENVLVKIIKNKNNLKILKKSEVKEANR